MSEPRYPGFAQVEYDYLRERFVPDFDWMVFERPSPRNTLPAPLAQARVALVSTAGAHLADQPPFDGKGDHTYREIPSASEDFRLFHVGYDVERASRDPDVVFPLALLRGLAAEGVIGELASRAFSFMGYTPDVGPLLAESGPAVARELLADAVDLVLLVPA